MKIDCIDEKTKEIILDEIFISEYKEVMRLCLDGKSYDEISTATFFSIRHIQRIVSICWREVCLRLAEQKANKILNFNVAIRDKNE